MAAKSKHYGDVANSIEKVIDSCESLQQERTARNLVNQFQKKYSNLHYPVYRELYLRLQNKLEEKFCHRLEKEIKNIK